jgi:hypothetical protein
VKIGKSEASATAAPNRRRAILPDNVRSEFSARSFPTTARDPSRQRTRNVAPRNAHRNYTFEKTRRNGPYRRYLAARPLRLEAKNEQIRPKEGVKK